jgi:hypothetical protein
LVIGALSHVVVLDKKVRDEYVQKRGMVATKVTPGADRRGAGRNVAFIHKTLWTTPAMALA